LKRCDRCGHEAARHYSGDSPEPEERGGNYCAAHDCPCRGFIEAPLVDCGAYLGYPKKRLGTLSYQCAELRLYGYTSERALDVAIDAAVVRAARTRASAVSHRTSSDIDQDGRALLAERDPRSLQQIHTAAPETDSSSLRAYATLAVFALAWVVGILVIGLTLNFSRTTVQKLNQPISPAPLQPSQKSPSTPVTAADLFDEPRQIPQRASPAPRPKASVRDLQSQR
jgi:hypothetical protein